MSVTMRNRVLLLATILALNVALINANWDETDFTELGRSIRSNAQSIGEVLIKAGKERIGRDLVESLADDDESCRVCKIAVTAAKELFLGKRYVEIRDDVIMLCKRALEGSKITRTDLFCPGVMDLQVPHVMRVVQSRETNPDNLCINLNLCFVDKQPNDAQVDNVESHNKKEAEIDPGFNAPEIDPGFNAPEIDPGFNAPADFLAAPDNGIDLDPAFNAAPGFLANMANTGNEKTNNTVPEKAARDIKIIQISDAHFDPKYAVGSPTDCGLVVCCHKDFAGTGSARLNGEFTCNIPERTLQALLGEVRKMQPDFILYSGDNPPHTLWEETRDSQFDCSRKAYTLMKNTFSGIKVFPSIGNHENYPTNIYNPEMEETKALNSLLSDLWTPLAGFGPEQQKTVKSAGYYSMLIRPGMRIININTNLWYTFNWYNTLNEIRREFTEMTNFLQDTLQSARDNKEKVLIQYHHPPGRFDQMHTASRRLRKIINSYDDIIFLQVAGHTHRDHFKIISYNNYPSSVVYIEPTMTTKDAFYPSIRVYHLDGKTFKVKDYDQYRYDILAQKPALFKAYSAKEEFNLKDMSAQSWYDFSSRLMKDVDLRAKWHLHNEGGVRKQCDNECFISKICDLRHEVYDEVVECIKRLKQSGQPISDPHMYHVTYNTAAHASNSVTLSLAVVFCASIGLIMRALRL